MCKRWISFTRQCAAYRHQHQLAVRVLLEVATQNTHKLGDQRAARILVLALEQIALGQALNEDELVNDDALLGIGVDSIEELNTVQRQAPSWIQRHQVCENRRQIQQRL